MKHLCMLLSIYAKQMEYFFTYKARGFGGNIKIFAQL